MIKRGIKELRLAEGKMCFAAILVAMLALSLTSVVEANDQIYLKDGSIVKGTILELTQTTCRIQTAYGVMDIDRADILRIESGAPRPEVQPSEGMSEDTSQPEKQAQPIKESPQRELGVFLDVNGRTLTVENGRVTHVGGGLLFLFDYSMIRFIVGPYTNVVAYKYKFLGEEVDYEGGPGVLLGIDVHLPYRPLIASSLVEYTINIRGNTSISPMDTITISGAQAETLQTDILYFTGHLWVDNMGRRSFGAVTLYGGVYLSAFEGYGEAASDLSGLREGQTIDDITGTAFCVGVLGGLELRLGEHSAGVIELAFGSRDSGHFRIGFAGKF
jgi:hypothetical protein